MTLPFTRPDPDCRQMEALLPPFVDGEARPDERAAVEAHLAACASCRDAVRAQRAVRDLLVRVKAYERATVRAALSGERAHAISALAMRSA